MKMGLWVPSGRHVNLHGLDPELRARTQPPS